MNVSEERTMANTEEHAVEDYPKAKSSSLDNLLLILAVLLFVGSCLALVGIIPVLIMIVGARLAFTSGDVRNMKVTARFVQIVALLGALICGFVAVTKQDNVDEAARRMQSAYPAYSQYLQSAAANMSMYDFYKNKTLYSPEEQAEYEKAFNAAYEYRSATFDFNNSKGKRNAFLACAAGIGSVALIIEFLWIGPFTRQLPVWRATRALKKTNAKKKRIIGRDSLASYSVADELLKWSKLREDGLITEDEYQEARMKLLNRG